MINHGLRIAAAHDTFRSDDQLTLLLTIEHVGSTAVPGLAAKPIIDIDVVVPTRSTVGHCINGLAPLGYVHEGDMGVVGREAFSTPDGLPYHHLYVVVTRSGPHLDHIHLRDYLRRNPREAKRYEARKRQLAPLLASDRTAYVDGKVDLVQQLLRAARQGHTEVH